MLKKIENNRNNIIHNTYGIKSNEEAIEINRRAITDLQKGFLPINVFEATLTRYEKIIHRLIILLAGVVALLVITNALWLYAWNGLDKSDTTTVIRQEGTTNTIGGADMGGEE